MTSETEIRHLPHDYRQENPGLHLLYVKTAVLHLHVIDTQIQELNDLANGFLNDIVRSMIREREYLVKNNPAYSDAASILEQINRLKSGEEAKKERLEEFPDNNSIVEIFGALDVFPPTSDPKETDE